MHFLGAHSAGCKVSVRAWPTTVRDRNFILECLLVCLVRFLTSTSASRLSRGRVPRLVSDNFTCCHTERARGGGGGGGGHDFCLNRSPTQRVGSGRSEPGSNQQPSYEKSYALLTEQPRYRMFEQHVSL